MAEEEKRFHEKLADRLIEAREAAGITQEKLAEKVGLQSNSNSPDMKQQREKMNFFYSCEGGRCSQYNCRETDSGGVHTQN